MKSYCFPLKRATVGEARALPVEPPRRPDLRLSSDPPFHPRSRSERPPEGHDSRGPVNFGPLMATGGAHRERCVMTEAPGGT